MALTYGRLTGNVGWLNFTEDGDVEVHSQSISKRKADAAAAAAKRERLAQNE